MKIMQKSNIPPLIASVAAICILISLWIPAAEEGRPAGWYEENGCRYYEYADGQRPDGWVIIEGKQYYFMNQGVPATGWLNLGQQRYFFRPDGTMATGWMNLAGMNYYFHGNGTMATGWCKLGEQQFYLGTRGAAANGPTKIDGELFLFDEEGVLANGIFLYEGVHYQADAEGHPLGGWAASGNTSFCFDEKGKALTGWQTIEDLPYYFYSDGTPAAGITEIDGITRHFSSFGQYIPLVNPWNYIPEDYTTELTAINASHSVSTIGYADYVEMMAACHADGMRAAVCSSFRTHEYQQRLFDRKMYYYCALGYEKSEAIELAGTSVAVPGTSEHQLGLAVDIVDTSNWSLDESQAETPAQQWLIEHSWEYGWILRYPDGKSEITGIIYEPWHYRYVGRRAAAEIHALDICLEEYFEMLTVG